ncbi:hypothetical protein RB195_002851 [Necator americanus]|uniref:glucuronosyltransferase n=1 Tax=Necator americanus TaxID=51031 RepID=A0ABR1DKZ5_NECAM
MNHNISRSIQISVHYVNASFGLTTKELERKQEKFIFEDLSLLDRSHLESVALMRTVFLTSCRKMLENKTFLDWLAAEKFDLAFGYAMNFCPVGIIHHAKIPTWIWLNSAPLIDAMANYMGVPIIPSYIPPIMMDSTDEMDFLERTKSLIGHLMTIPTWKWMLNDPETAMFRELIDPNFPNLIDLAKQCPLVMVNSNDLYDIPRPTLAKIVNIGGVGIQAQDVKPLSTEFQRIVDDAEGIVVFSFGSVAPSDRMPMSWKMAFIDAFKRFPKYHFFWRYVGADLKDKLPSNVHTFKWLPQSDLVQNPKIAAIITHGGYNSLQEAMLAGVPLITVPLFGDQPRNARLAEKHGFAVNIRKSDVNADTIAEALNKIITDRSYSENIKRLSQMGKKQPVNASHLVVSWAEFVAEFKTLENLVPAGTKLNFFQYYSLDVISFLLSSLALILYLLWTVLKLTVKKLYNLYLSTKKEKHE